MPAATTQDDLISITEKEYDKLASLLENLEPSFALRPFEDGTSIKDVIGHRAHWTRLFFDWHRQGQENGAADVPAKGYKWNQLKEYNAKLRDSQKGLGWDSALKMLASSHVDLLDFIEMRSDEDLYGGPMPGGGSKWTTGRWAEASGASHYRSAAKFVRACLRQRH